MNDFLPKGYKIPEKPSNYLNMREEGSYTFRPMSSPIIGWETWKDTPEGGRTPIRKRMDDLFDTADVDPSEVKHFWAFIVWNYKSESFQILEITQATIQKAIKALVRNDKWGNPKGKDGYDLVITREGLTMQDTNYSVSPNPKEELDTKIVDAYKENNIKLEALYDGADPFQIEEIKVPKDFGK